MGPPCPNCGTTLTWHAQSNAWGCDRCRVMFPPQQPQAQAPQQPQYPQPQQYQQPQQPQYQQPQQYQQPVIPKTVPIDTFQQQHYPSAQGLRQHQQESYAPVPVAAVAAPSGLSTKLLIGAGIGVVLAAGAAIAFVVTRKPAASFGAASRDELVKVTYKLLADGDLDGLMKRSAIPSVNKYTTCKHDAGSTPEGGVKELEAMRREMQRAAIRLKGAVIKVGKITEPDKAETLAKGADIGHDCTLDAPLEMHKVIVQLDIVHDSGPSEMQMAEMQVAKIAGRWVYTRAPKIPGCTAAVSRIAVVASMDTHQDDTINSLQPVLMSRCLGDEWGATVIKCLEGATAVSDVPKCLAALTPKEIAPLTKEVEAALAGAPRTAKELRAILPDAVEEKPADIVTQAPPPTTPAMPGDPDAALVDDTLVLDAAPPDANADDPGRPEEADQGDFWLWTRDDKSVRVTSPVVKAVFPGRPEQRLEKGGGKTLDGKDIWLYQFIYDLGEDGELRLEISSMGRGASGADQDPLIPMMAKIGKVKRKKSVIEGVPVVDLEALEASSGGTLRTHAIRDLKRGLIIVGVAATSPKTRKIGTQFLASITELMGDDPAADPKVLADIAIKKVKKRYLASTQNDDFSIELFAQPKITRTDPEPGKSFVTSTLVAEKKQSHVTVQITEHASWDALGFHPAKQEQLANEMKDALEKQTGGKMTMTPGRLAGVTGYSVDPAEKTKPKVEFRMMWNRYQHRTYMLFCIETDCDAVVKTIKFSPPSAE